MTTYLAQMRVVKLRDPDEPADKWSSATSTMTVYELSVPYEDDDEAKAITRALGVLSHEWVKHRPLGRHMDPDAEAEGEGVAPSTV